MNSGQITLIQKSYERILPIKDCVSMLFYIRLFELCPELRVIIERNQEVLGCDMADVVLSAINVFDDFESSVLQLEKLGRRYASLGVKNHHYSTVGEALLWSLEQGLDKEFTEDTKVAWRWMCSLIFTAMRSASDNAAA